MSFGKLGVISRHVLHQAGLLPARQHPAANGAQSLGSTADLAWALGHQECAGPRLARHLENPHVVLGAGCGEPSHGQGVLQTRAAPHVDQVVTEGCVYNSLLTPAEDQVIAEDCVQDS